MSRSKDALYRESGEAEYDEAGSPPAPASGRDKPEAAVQPKRPVLLPKRR
jgi:hypothetical protein